MVQVSPGVRVTEVDLTTTPQAVGTTTGGFAGYFKWGPVEEAVTVADETRLYGTFRGPDDDNFADWFLASNFLSYGNDLRLVRVTGATANNAASGTALRIENEDAYPDVAKTTAGQWVAKYPGNVGNSLKVSVCPNSTVYSGGSLDEIFPSTVTVSNTDPNVLTFADSAVTGAITDVTPYISPGDSLIISDDTYEVATAGVAGLVVTLNENLAASVTDISTISVPRWTYADSFDRAPGTSNFATNLGATNANDEIHVAVIDENGDFSGTAETVLETFQGVSVGTNARAPEGGSLHYEAVINRDSQYVWIGMEDDALIGGADSAVITPSSEFDKTRINFIDASLTGGTDEVPGSGDYITGYNVMRDREETNVSLMIGPAVTGATNDMVADHIIGIAEAQKDMIVCVSPNRESVIGSGASADAIVTYRNLLTSSSYAFMDSGWKLQYDKYNGVNRWVPLCGDVAGTFVVNDLEADPWYSPARISSGRIRNVVRLAYNPSTMADRDTLYRGDVNPVVTFAGEGTRLFGDKTLLGYNSAFDRVNVRRLFIVLRTSIAAAARQLLFDFNDPFTRAQFRNFTEPYLRNVQGRRGITDFLVVCDESNNPQSVIDANEFRAQIFVKPNRSINFITLEFIATQTGVEFNEIVGSV